MPRPTVFLFFHLLIVLAVVFITKDAIIDEIAAMNIAEAFQTLAVFCDSLAGDLIALTPHISLHRFIRKPTVFIFAQKEEQIIAELLKITSHIKAHLKDAIDLERVVDSGYIETGIFASSIHKAHNIIAA